MPDWLLGPEGVHQIEMRRFRGHDYPMFRDAPRSLNAILDQAFARHRAAPDRPFFIENGEITSFGQFDASAAALALSLRSGLQVAKRRHVAIAMANRAELMVSFVAILAVGAVPVLVNSRGAGEEMRRAIARADCTAIICDEACFERIAETGPAAVPVVLLGAPRQGSLDFREIAAPVPGLTLAFERVGEEDSAMILFSSGTTGFPKAILHCHGTAAHSLLLGLLVNKVFDAQYEAEFGESPYAGLSDPNPPAVLASPLFHIGGMVPILRSMVMGQPTIFVAKWNVGAVFDILERYEVVRLGLVPTMLYDLLASPRAASGLLSRIRIIANGTSALSPQMIEDVRARLPRCSIINTLGQTEMLERMTTFGGRELMANPAAVGRVLPTVQLRIVRDDGSDAQPGEAGEVAVFGAMTMAGYYNDPEATAATIRDGWVMTGDVGYFDDNELLHLVDRKKNMVIAGGENIYCAEVERVMAAHRSVAEALAFGEPDARLGERLVAVAVLKPGQEVSEDELKAHCRAHLAIYKVPRAIGLVATPLPRNATGKVAKGEFLAGYVRPWAARRE
jgi:long-chain acyl-CoA synthetase